MRRFGLIGKSLRHSFSQGYFTEKFLKEGRTDHVYDQFELDTIGAFPFLLEQHPDLVGLNVTLPYKKEILRFVHLQDPAVAAIGACNCIRIAGGRLEAFNTDYIGFRDSLMPLLRPQHLRALVLGNGGAAAAVRYALKSLGIQAMSVSRQPSNESIGYADLDAPVIGGHTLIVNTTPLGTWPDTEACPDLPYHLLGPEHLLYDLVYNPEITTFMRRGAEQGAQVKNGYEMLVRQAEAAWEIWNGGRG